jgi:magnesium-transporting ATPase (P-type)
MDSFNFPIDPDFLAKIHEKTPEELYAGLQSRPDGLTQEDAQQRLAVFGPNLLKEAKGTPLIVKFLANFTHLMAIMLWVAGIGAFLAQMPQLGIAVWAVNVIKGVFSFFQEYPAEKATEALKKILPQTAASCEMARKSASWLKSWFPVMSSSFKKAIIFPPIAG